MMHPIIQILIILFIQEYMNPLLILPTVIKRSNTITVKAIIEGIIKITPNCPQPSAPILCKLINKPYDDKINPIILQIIDITSCILNCFIYFPLLLFNAIFEPFFVKSY